MQPFPYVRSIALYYSGSWDAHKRRCQLIKLPVIIAVTQLTQFGRQTPYGRVRIRKASMQNSYKEDSLCKITCMLQCGTYFLTIAQYRLSRRQLKREMIWQTPHFIGSLVGCASCCNWRTRQAVRPYEGFPSTGFILWCLTWWQAYPFAAVHPLILCTNRQGFMFSWNSVHVFVPHGSILPLRSHHLVEIECETNRTALTGQAWTLQKVRDLVKVAGGYIDNRDGAILSFSNTEKCFAPPKNPK